MDDTIENLCDAWVKALNTKYGLSVNVDDINNWDMSVAFPQLTKQQIVEILYDKDFWYSVEPKRDAMEYLKRLYDEGHNIFLCTATHYGTAEPKMKAIVERYFPFIDWKHIITCNYKQMIKCDILVDDGVHNLFGGDYTPILFTANHNRNYDEKMNNVFRANNWEEVYNYIHKNY